MKTIKEYLYEKPKYHETVVGYICQENKVLLGIRKKVSFGLGEELIAGIGGKIEEGETAVDALKREVKEEVEIEIEDIREMGRVLYLFPHKPNWNQRVTIYIIDTWHGDPSETDVIKPLWFHKDKLPNSRMWPDNLITIPLVISGKQIEGVFLYDENGKIIEQKIDLK